MRFRPVTSRMLPVLATVAALTLSACGGEKPADRAAASAQTSAAPAAAPAENVAPPTEAPAAQTAPPPVAPPASRPASKPAATQTVKHESPRPPKPEPVVKTVAAGTDVEVELVDAVSSKTSQVGNPVRVRVTKPVVVDGLAVVPAGAVISGTVTEAVSLKKIGGTASLGVMFDTLEIPGGAKTGIAMGLHEKGHSETGKDAGTIAGATAGGALLGRLLSKDDKTKGTLIGAAVGAAAGTGAAAATKGKEVEHPAGTPLVLRLEQPVNVTVEL